MPKVTIKKALENRLKGASKIAVLGIGSELRGDDVAGMLVAQALDKNPGKKNALILKVFFGSTAPENLTGEIKKFKPDHVVMIDTIEIKERPGTIIVLNPHEIGEGVSFSTHKMPAKILADYFVKSFKCDVTIVGIQPASLEFGKTASKEIKDSARQIARAIKDIVHGK